MFDVGFSELVLLAIVALVVLGPEKLPHAARIAGAWVGRIRRTVASIQADIEREVSLQEMKSRLQKDLAEPGNRLWQELQAERESLSQPLQDVEQTLRAPLAAPDSTILDADTAAAGHAVASTRPQPSPQPPALDGETAYREWLAAQRRSQNASTPAPSSAVEPPAHD